ncbi:MAG: YDG domain-containing protein, partial [Comamonadaceae bacterium]
NQTIADSYAVTLNGGTSVVNTAADIIVSSGVSIAKTAGGDATLTLKAQSTIIFGAGTSISSSSNRLNLILWADSNNDNNGGVRLEGATSSRVAISTNGGGIWIGGSNTASTASWTPYTGATALTVGDGQAKSGGIVFAVNLDYASLNAGAGNINISGRSYATGGGYGIGVRMNDAASVIGNNITISGTGSINGSGNNNNWGVSLEGGSSITGTGAVSVTGTGGGGSPGNNYGVYVAGSSSAITATGTGTVSVTGSGGGATSSAVNTSDNNHGVYLTGGGKISAVNGDISVTGTGGVIAKGLNQYGVYLNEDNSSITTSGSGSGSITVLGTAGAGGDGSANVTASNTGYGVYLNDPTTPGIATYPSITASGTGNVSITGTAAGKSGGTEVGIALNAGKVSSISGTLNLNGTGGIGSANSTGVSFSGASITSTTGDIAISGTAGNSTATTNHSDINLASGITSSSGNISLTTDNYVQGDVDIAAGSGAISINADTVALGTNTGSNPLQTTGAITLQPKTSTTAMSLGGSSTFDLSATEIAYLKGSAAPSITIGGNSSTGVMTLGAAVALAGKAVNFKAGSLTDGATTTNIITAASVNLVTTGGDIGGSTTNAAIDIAAATVSATTSGSAYLKSGTGFALGQSTVGGTLSLATSGAGSVTQSGKLTVGTLTATLAGGSTDKLNLGSYANAISNIGNVTAKGGVSLNNGNNSVTVAGNISSAGGTSTSAIDINVGTGTYTQNANVQVETGTTAAGISITADNMVFGSNTSNNALYTLGALTLQPATITRGITLGGTAETAGQLVLQGSEIEAFKANGSSNSLLTIGGNTSGAMTIAGPFSVVSGGALLLKAGSIADTGTNTITLGTGSSIAGTLWLSAINNGASIGSVTDNIDFSASYLRAYTVGTGSAYVNSPTWSYSMKASNVGGTLALGLAGTDKIISQDNMVFTGSITVGALKLNTIGRNVRLINSKNAISALSGDANDLTIVNSSGLNVGTTRLTGNLYVENSAPGSITSSGALTVGGTTSINVGSTSDVTLNYPGTDFGGAISIKGAKNFTMSDTNAVLLKYLNLSNTLNITAADAITQTLYYASPYSVDSWLTVQGAMSLTAGTDITLADTHNGFAQGTVSIPSARDVQITSTGHLHLGSANLRTLTAIAGAGGGSPTAGALWLDPGARIVSSNNPTDTGNINSVVLVAGDYKTAGMADPTGVFINKAGADAITLTGGNGSRWQIWSNNPYNPTSQQVYYDQFGGLKSGNEAVYGTYWQGHEAGPSGSWQIAAIPGNIAAGNGNRYVFRVQASENPGYNPNTVTISTSNVAKTYGDAVSLTTADNTAITYSTGGMKFAEFSAPKPSWLTVGSLHLSSSGIGATAHAGTYPLTVSGGISSTGAFWLLPSLGPDSTPVWTANDGTHTVTINANSNVVVSPRTLTATVSGGVVQDRVYDGTTTATFSTAPTFTIGNTANGDAVTLPGTIVGNFADKNVETGKVASLSGLSVNSTHAGVANSGDYVLPALPTYTGSITTKALTLSALADTAKTYDGTVLSSGTPSVSALASGDSIANLTQVFADKNAGSGIAINVADSYVLNDGNGGKNYSVTLAPASGTINKAALTMTAVDNAKVLNDTDPNLTAKYSGFVSGENASVLGNVSVTRAAGETPGSYTITPSASASNYTVTPASGTFTVEPADKLLVQVSDASTTYGTAPTLAITSAKYYSSTGAELRTLTVTNTSGNTWLAEDGLGTTYTFNLAAASTSAGNYAIGLTGTPVQAGSNFSSVAFANGNLATAPLAISASADAISKTYDGTAAATTAAATIDNLVSGDAGNVSIAGTGTFTDKSAGVGNKTYTFTGLSLSGSAAGNYYLSASDRNAGLSNSASTITPKDLALSGLSAGNKVYDGTSAATLGGSAAVAALSGDNVTLGGSATGSFADKNVATGKAVSVTGLTLGGADAGNYTLVAQAGLTADVTKANLAVIGLASTGKVYDGTTVATLTGSATVAALSGDSVTIGGTPAGAFANKNVGTAKPVTVTGSTLSGTDAGNYTLVEQTGLSADVSQAALTITAAANSKTYDAGTTASATPTYAGLKTGDTITGLTEAYSDGNAGSGKTLNVSAYTVNDSNNGANYSVSTVANNAGVINQADLTITATSNTKVYDGSSTAAATPTVTGLKGSDTVSALAETYADKNAGSSKSLTVSAYTVNDSNGGANYNVITVADSTGVITSKPLALAGSTGVVKTYDGTVGMPGVPGYGSLGAVETGDTLSVAGMPVFSSKDVGSRNIDRGTVSLTGADAANYSLVWTSGSGTINQAALSVKADNDARFFGQTDTAGYAGVSYSGFVNGETSGTAGLGGTLVIARSGLNGDGSGDAVGSYTLTPTGVTAGNYTITHQTGSYTIAPAGQLLVKVTDASTSYGTAATYTVASAQYMSGSTVTTATPSANGNSITVDGVTFTLAPVSPSNSTGGFLKAGSYQLGGTVTGGTSSNFSNNLVVVGAQQVSAKALTANASGVSKTYDGTTAMTGVTIGLTGKETGDVVTVTGSGSFADKNASATANKSYTLSGLTLGSTDAANYYLTGGTSFSGINGQINAAPLTVTANDASKVYDGNTTATLTPGNFSLSGFATGEGASVTKTSGTYDTANAGTGKTVTVNLASSDYSANSGTTLTNYTLPTTVSGTIGTITKAHLTVTADDKTRLYGDANPTLTSSITGYVNSENASTAGITGAPTLATAATTTTGVGTVAITAAANNLAAANYDFAYTNGALTINKAHLTVTADNQSRLYGAANPTFSETISGFVNSENASSAGVTGTATGSTAATATTGVGTATITASNAGLSAANYDFPNLVNGTLTIAQAPLTVTASNASKTYDGAAYSGGNGVAYSGFVNSESSSVLG